MNIEEARLYLEHTSKDDFNLEEWQKENRYKAIQVILQEIERLNNIINNFEKWLEEYMSLLEEPDIYEEQTLEDLKEVLDKLRELKGDSSNE